MSSVHIVKDQQEDSQSVYTKIASSDQEKMRDPPVKAISSDFLVTTLDESYSSSFVDEETGDFECKAMDKLSKNIKGKYQKIKRVSTKQNKFFKTRANNSSQEELTQTNGINEVMKKIFKPLSNDQPDIQVTLRGTVRTYSNRRKLGPNNTLESFGLPDLPLLTNAAGIDSKLDVNKTKPKRLVNAEIEWTSRTIDWPNELSDEKTPIGESKVNLCADENNLYNPIVKLEQMNLNEVQFNSSPSSSPLNTSILYERLHNSSLMNNLENKQYNNSCADKNECSHFVDNIKKPNGVVYNGDCKLTQRKKRNVIDSEEILKEVDYVNAIKTNGVLINGDLHSPKWCHFNDVDNVKRTRSKTLREGSFHKTNNDDIPIESVTKVDTVLTDLSDLIIGGDMKSADKKNVKIAASLDLIESNIIKEYGDEVVKGEFSFLERVTTESNADIKGDNSESHSFESKTEDNHTTEEAEMKKNRSSERGKCSKSVLDVARNTRSRKSVSYQNSARIDDNIEVSCIIENSHNSEAGRKKENRVSNSYVSTKSKASAHQKFSTIKIDNDERNNLEQTLNSQITAGVKRRKNNTCKHQKVDDSIVIEENTKNKQHLKAESNFELLDSSTAAKVQSRRQKSLSKQESASVKAHGTTNKEEFHPNKKENETKRKYRKSASSLETSVITMSKENVTLDDTLTRVTRSHKLISHPETKPEDNPVYKSENSLTPKTEVNEKLNSEDTELSSDGGTIERAKTRKRNSNPNHRLKTAKINDTILIGESSKSGSNPNTKSEEKENIESTVTTSKTRSRKSLTMNDSNLTEERSAIEIEKIENLKNEEEKRGDVDVEINVKPRKRKSSSVKNTNTLVVDSSKTENHQKTINETMEFLISDWNDVFETDDEDAVVSNECKTESKKNLSFELADFSKVVSDGDSGENVLATPKQRANRLNVTEEPETTETENFKLFLNGDVEEKVRSKSRKSTRKLNGVNASKKRKILNPEGSESFNHDLEVKVSAGNCKSTRKHRSSQLDMTGELGTEKRESLSPPRGEIFKLSPDGDMTEKVLARSRKSIQKQRSNGRNVETEKRENSTLIGIEIFNPLPDSDMQVKVTAKSGETTHKLNGLNITEELEAEKRENFDLLPGGDIVAKSRKSIQKQRPNGFNKTEELNAEIDNKPIIEYPNSAGVDNLNPLPDFSTDVKVLAKRSTKKRRSGKLDITEELKTENIDKVIIEQPNSAGTDSFKLLANGDKEEKVLARSHKSHAKQQLKTIESYDELKTDELITDNQLTSGDTTLEVKKSPTVDDDDIKIIDNPSATVENEGIQLVPNEIEPKKVATTTAHERTIKGKRKLSKQEKTRLKRYSGNELEMEEDKRKMQEVLDGPKDCNIGEIWWGRLGSYPYWPCVITANPETSEYKKLPNMKNATHVVYHVTFFADKGRRNWTRRLIPYQGPDDLKKYSESAWRLGYTSGRINELFSVKPHTQNKWKNAVDEAESVKNKSVEERLNFFNRTFMNETFNNTVRFEKYNDTCMTVNLDETKKSHKTKKQRRRTSLMSNGSASDSSGEWFQTNNFSSEISFDDEIKKKTKRKNKLGKKKDLSSMNQSNTELPENKSNSRKSDYSIIDFDQEHFWSIGSQVTKKGKKIKQLLDHSVSAITNETVELLKTEPSQYITNQSLPEVPTDTFKKRSRRKSMKMFDDTTGVISELLSEDESVPSADDDNYDAFIAGIQPIKKRRGRTKKSKNDELTESRYGDTDKPKIEFNVHPESLKEEKSLDPIDTPHPDANLGKKSFKATTEEPEKSITKKKNNGILNSTVKSPEAKVKRFKTTSQLELSLLEEPEADEENQNSHDLDETSSSWARELSKLQIEDLDEASSGTREKIKRFVENFQSRQALVKKNIFKGVTKEKVCQICELTGNVVKCKGPCNGDYHIHCVQNSFAAIEGGIKHEEKPKTGQVQIVTVKSRKNLPLHNILLSPVNRNMPVNDQIDNKMEELMSRCEDYQQESTDSGSDEQVIEKFKGKPRKSITKTHPHIFEHVTADSVSIISLNVNASKKATEGASTEDATFKCPHCVSSSVHPACFVCGEVTSKTGNDKRQRCSMQRCGRFYHLECLDNSTWPQTRWSFVLHQKSKTDALDSFVCPRHECHTCASENSSVSIGHCPNYKLAKCLRCPATYHNSHHCVPAGTDILTASQLVCPRHTRTKKMKTCNTPWCFVCSEGGRLTCCENCPTSVHSECLLVKLRDDGTYVCEDCESGRFPLYGEIVWVKCGAFRWWPAVILFPSEVPPNVQQTAHSRGEFVVQFFGTYNYFWVGRGKAFLYQEGDTGCLKSSKNRIDEAFESALQEAAMIYAIKAKSKTTRDEELNNGLKPPPFVRIKVNRPVGNVRMYDGNTSNTTACDCDPNDSNPCGPNSNCLNRLLLTECNPDICRAGKNCNNQRFEQRNYPQLAPYRTAGRGWGLKLLEPAEKGQFIIEYVGELIDDEEYLRRVKKMNELKDNNYYFLTIDKDQMLDAGPKGNVARFMNHSCQPNCETQKWTVKGRTRVGLFAIDDIPANTELTFNYNLESIGTERKVCLCGAPNCSGYIGVKPEDQKNSKKNQIATKNVITRQSCFVCGETGEVYTCSRFRCKRSFHLKCANLESCPEDKWICASHTCDTCSKRTTKCCLLCTKAFCMAHFSSNLNRVHDLEYLCNLHYGPIDGPNPEPNNQLLSRLKRNRPSSRARRYQKRQRGSLGSDEEPKSKRKKLNIT